MQSIASARFSSFSELKTRFIRLFCLPICCKELVLEKENVNHIEKSYLRYLDHKLKRKHSQSVIQSKPRRRASRGDSYNLSAGTKRSQVGQAMTELTARRVHLGVMLTLLITALFTYVETDASNAVVMVILHSQSGSSTYRNLAVDSARKTSKNTLYEYNFCDGELVQYISDADIDKLRDREKLVITVEQQGDLSLLSGNYSCSSGEFTRGYFSLEDQVEAEAVLQILVTLFAITIWIVGARMFSSPVMSLVATPIERMVRLLGMLTRDPLGYQSSLKFKLFQSQEENIVKQSGFTQEALAGMET